MVDGTEAASSVAGKLARLRRDAARGASREPGGPTLGDREHRAREHGAREIGAREIGAHDARPRAVGLPAGLAEELGAHGPALARTTRIPASLPRGAFRPSDVAHADPRLFALLTGDAALGALDPRRALFLDTETTGLEGGAGTYVFLIGLGWLEGDELVVWQGFLQGPAEERALLAVAGERIGAAASIVSFFGRVFDRHRLEDKMRVHGLALPFGGRAHLDLCFPLRRLTKGALPDGRLQTLERHLLGMAREDDLPGALAPAAWFDFVAERAHRLEDVFRHNLDDVVSLAALTAYLGRAESEAAADGTPLAGCSATRAAALARAHAAAGSPAEAALWFARALERSRDESAVLDVARLALDHAAALRRAERCDEARATLEGLLSGGAGASPIVSARAGELLLKVLERDCKDPAAALAWLARLPAELATPARVARLTRAVR